MYFVYQFQQAEDPKGLTEALWRHKIAHQIVLNKAHNELWIMDPQQLPTVKSLFELWQQDPILVQKAHFEPVATSLHSGERGLLSQVRSAPVTSIVLVLTVLVALLTQLGGDLNSVGYFSISPLEIRNGQIYFFTLSQVVDKHEYWRFFSPALLHFSVLHIVFNTLWIWDIGGKLERILGSFVWSLGVVIIAVLSNVLQYYISGYPLFGGLSGVVYGLIGFAWLLPLLDKHWPTLISQQLMAFFMVWLAVGYTPLPEMLGLGGIANTAHTIGLLSGITLAVVYGLLTRLIARNTHPQ
ncbi:rhomboid family intramembrane serine protease [Marinomonas sp. IMCC 4694]|uniref:rhomboid family intramembrane serine protease n=1 Tax=Marinomonas sp. IMCC 4694 TaxID=2605432 RepID=UPI0011E701E9|nr:rhomboid family intramembrane serine protease [Marinomonas sp. IMCC 4694]TYL47779.1 rhomboid family intramembrane serine protease [Marinomonas sp. IMCC 4694]